MEDEPKKKSPRSEQFTQPMFVFELEQPPSSPPANQPVASAPPDSRQPRQQDSLVKTAHMFGSLSAEPPTSLDADRDVRGGYAAASLAGVRVVPTAFVGVPSSRNTHRAEPALDGLSPALPEALAAISLAACQVIQAPHARRKRPAQASAPVGAPHPEQSEALAPSQQFGAADNACAQRHQPELGFSPVQRDARELSITPLCAYHPDLNVTAISFHLSESNEAPVLLHTPKPSVVLAEPPLTDLSTTPLRPYDILTPAHSPAPNEAILGTRASSVPAPEGAAESPTRAAPAALAEPLKVSARSPLFRREALLAYRRGERAASVLQVTSVSRWALLLALACALALALGVVSFGQVEERSAARGVLRMPFGLQPVVPLIGGTVREVLVSPGALVKAGQLLVRLDATPLAAELFEAEQRLSALEAQWRRQSESLKSDFERGLTLTNARVSVLEQRRRNQARRIARRHSQAERMEAPELAEVVERTVREQSADALDGAKDELLQLSDGLSELRLQQSASRSAYEQQLAAGEQRLRDARARRDAARTLLQQSELHAPIAGKVESLRVHAGQTVQPGEWVARVVRDELPSSIVAFVPERDAAFLRKGAPANVEIDKLPMGEFGFARARVQRVVGEIAESSELTAALGDTAPQGPHVRVELALEQTPETARVRPFLRAGTLVTARIALRDRRLLAIVFEPARRWLR